MLKLLPKLKSVFEVTPEFVLWVKHCHQCREAERGKVVWVCFFPLSTGRVNKCLRSRESKNKHQHCLDQDRWYGLGKAKLGALVMAEGWLEEV